jgi:hypothetical protein
MKLRPVAVLASVPAVLAMSAVLFYAPAKESWASTVFFQASSGDIKVVPKQTLPRVASGAKNASAGKGAAALPTP